MWTPLHYRFDDRAAFLAAVLAAGWRVEPHGEILTDGAAVDEIGPLVAPPSIDSNRRPAPGAVQDARWHVNILWPGDEHAAFAAAQVSPATPTRAFGVPPPPAPTPQYTPDEVPAWKARIVLAEAGLLATVEAAIAQAPPRIQVAWAHKPTWRRNSPMINAMAQAVSLSNAQVRALFRDADAIPG